MKAYPGGRRFAGNTVTAWRRRGCSRRCLCLKRP